MRLYFFLFFLPVVLGAMQPTVEFAGQVGDFRRGGGVELWAPVYQSGSVVCFGQGVGGSFLVTGTGAVMNNRLSQLKIFGANGDGLLISSNAAASNGVTVKTLIQNSTFGGHLAVDSIGEKAINLVGTALGATGIQL